EVPAAPGPSGALTRSGSVDEGEAVGGGPRAVEPLEAELAPSRIAPEADHVAPSEEAEPRIVEEDHRMLGLDERMLAAEMERVLVRGPLQAARLRADDRLRRRDSVIEPHQHDVASARDGESADRKVLAAETGVGVAVVAGRHQFLGRSAITHRHTIDAHGRPSRVAQAAEEITRGLMCFGCCR